YLDKNDLSILPKITITPPTDKIGERAAEQLLKRIKKEEEENEKVIVMENIIHGIN
ncbi:TPA: LacI family transcriptional regulator, partial [Enterococcus faecium]